MSELITVTKEEYEEILAANPGAKRIDHATTVGNGWTEQNRWDDPDCFLQTFDHETFIFVTHNKFHENYWYVDSIFRLGTDGGSLNPSVAESLHRASYVKAFEDGIARRAGDATLPLILHPINGYNMLHLHWGAQAYNGGVWFFADLPIIPDVEENNSFVDAVANDPANATDDVLPPVEICQKYLQRDMFDNGKIEERTVQEKQLYVDGLQRVGGSWVRETILKARV